MATRYMDMLSYDPEQERKATEYIHQHRAWFIGFCIGIDLIVEGVGWLMLSWGAETSHSQQTPQGVTR